MGVRDLQSLLTSAEQAAAAGDYASAEARLREAADLQEAQLGPLHPDLANTLNNLAVVCEITDKPADAERCYRRALAIASAAHPADHPFVATSRKNLEDFCAARDIPVAPAVQQTEPPYVPPARAVQQTEPPYIPPAPAARLRLPASAFAEASADRRSLGGGWSARQAPVVLGAGIVAALVVVILIATRPWSRSSETTQPAAEAPSHSPAPSAAAAPTVKNSGRVVADARLCRSLTDWRCDRATSPVSPGPLVFFTRIKSARNTTVQHRWYYGSQLRRSIDREIVASPTEGYRTYSRHIVDGASAGDWRVEVRAKDGSLLHEERFVVR